MFKYLFASLALAFVSLGAAPQAQAGIIPIVWGTSDHFDVITKLTIPAELKGDVPPEWTAGEAPELAHHSQSFSLFWIAGLSLSDMGLAVHVPGGNEFWEVTPDDLKMFKEAHLVPADLTDTGIAPMTYVLSFLGYGLIAGVGLVALYVKLKT